METNASAASPAASTDTAAVLPTTSLPASVATPPITTIPPVPTLPAYAKPFLDISRIEVFSGQNYKRWQERIYSILDMNGLALLLTTEHALPNSKAWTYANKVCRHTILTMLSNELFDVYCAYKEAKVIWDSMLKKYTTEDVGKQKFVVGNYYKWEMVDNKDIKLKINEYHKLLEELKAEKIELPEQFVARLLIEKLPDSWSEYKQHLKHKQKQLSLGDLITHVIIEDTNRKEQKVAKVKQMSTKANLVQIDTKRYKNKSQNLRNKPKISNPHAFKKRGTCFVCGKPGHHAPQCRKRVKTGNSGNPPKANLVEGDDIIAAVISQANMVTNSKNWVVDSGATRHVCANKDAFTSYTPVGDDEKVVYLGDSHTAQALGKGKVMLKLTPGKTLALNNVLHIPNRRANLVLVALLGKVGVKVSFESDKIIMTKDNIFVEKGFCNQGLFVLSISEVMNENASSSAYLVDSYDIWHARLGHVSSGYIKKMQTLGLINNIDYSGLSKCQMCATSKLTK